MAIFSNLFLRHAKIIAFFFGGYKTSNYLCNCQNQCSNTQTKGAMNIKPRTY